MSTLEFAPLSLPVSSVSEGLDTTYKVIATNGDVVTVEASCAAEAIEKSGISRPLRIISIAQEQRRMMQQNVLHPQDKTVHTNIDTENFVPDFRSLVVDDLEEEEKPPFEECSLGDIANRKLDKLPEKPKPVQKPAPVEAKPVPAPPPVQEELSPPEPEPAPPPPPVEQELITPDRELTPDEVEALMNAREVPGE